MLFVIFACSFVFVCLADAFLDLFGIYASRPFRLGIKVVFLKKCFLASLSYISLLILGLTKSPFED